MPPELRDRYRAEREAHVLDQIEDDEISGTSSLRSAGRLLRGLIAGMPADIALAIRPFDEFEVNVHLLLTIVAVFAIVSVIVVRIQGADHLRHTAQISAIRWLRGAEGVLLLVGGGRLLTRSSAKTRTRDLVISAAVLVLIGAYLVRVGVSPR